MTVCYFSSPYIEMLRAREQWVEVGAWGEGELKLFHNFLDGSETAGKKVEKAAAVFQRDTHRCNSVHCRRPRQAGQTEMGGGEAEVVGLAGPGQCHGSSWEYLFYIEKAGLLQWGVNV